MEALIMVVSIAANRRLYDEMREETGMNAEKNYLDQLLAEYKARNGECD